MELIGVPVTLPILSTMPGQHVFCQDDKTRPHRVRIVTECLIQNGVNHMQWPALSSDVHPIEHVWDMLVRRVYAHQSHPAKLTDLRRVLNEWQNIDQRQIGKLIRGMQRHCQTCIEALGGRTSY